jgi:hypothetical protein
MAILEGLHMGNLNLYSVDLSLWEGSESLDGKSLEDVTKEDWEGMIKGLYDWLRILQKAEGKRMPSDERLRDLMYAYGKRRPLHFVLVTVISKSHKKRLERPLKPCFWHAHVLVYGYCASAVVGLIKHYWAGIKGYARSEKNIYSTPCYDTGKLKYNMDQCEGKPKLCVSPVLTSDDLTGMYYDAVEDFEKSGRLKTDGVIKAIEKYGNVLEASGYSAMIREKWVKSIRPDGGRSSAV